MRALRRLPYLPLGWALRSRRSGEAGSVLARPGWGAPATIEVASESFPAGGEIPDRCCQPWLGENLSPQLSWHGVPEEARALMVVVEDLDFPLAPRPGVHTVGLLAAHVRELPEGAMTPDLPGARWAPMHRGRVGYHGPMPLPGHGAHRYWLRVLALDVEVGAAVLQAGLDGLDAAVAGHVIAVGGISGWKRG